MDKPPRNTPAQHSLLAGIQITFVLLFSPQLIADTDNLLCQTDAFDDRISIRYVIDGDTVVLDDGRKLRLIGVDTPELGQNDKPGQPWAKEAREYLSTLLQGHEDDIAIVYDQEHQDKYQRVLGHIFLPGGVNIQAMILAKGFATPLTVPPNLGFLDCYRSQARQATIARSGIWSQSQYQRIPATSLTGIERGYHIVTGKVSRIGESSSSIWINIGDSLALRIVKIDLKYFADLDIYALKGKTIEARGMVYNRNEQLRIRIRHPVDIQLLSNQQGAQ